MKTGKFDFITSKPFIIAALLLLMLIPLSFIKSLVEDRSFYRSEAIDSISMPIGGKPQIQGIFIALPYWEETSRETFSGGIKNVEVIRNKKYLITAPTDYQIKSDIKPYFLSRGIFKVPAFTADLDTKVEFKPVDFKQFSIEERMFIKDECILLLGISSTKILTELPEFSFNGTTLKQSELKLKEISPFTQTIFYTLPDSAFNTNFVITSRFTIQGSERIDIVPIAENNDFSMTSSWKSPSFSGGWLPVDRRLDDNGFSANWKIPGLSTVFSHAWKIDGTNFDFSNDSWSKSNSVRTELILPVDNYQKTTRSVKYGILFLLVPFIALFLCELFLKIKVHPIQYCLIGIADILFYLLLLSISEHLSFWTSYFISAAAVCISTLFYTSGVFKNFKWGLILSGIQLISYIFLFGTLQAEDYALLIGSIGLFVVIVLLMALTRKIDWYALRQPQDNDSEQ